MSTTFPTTSRSRRRAEYVCRCGKDATRIVLLTGPMVERLCDSCAPITPGIVMADNRLPSATPTTDEEK